jgi:hypothetical protein
MNTNAVAFSQAFRTHAAIQELVSAAFRDGVPVFLEAAVAMLRSADPDTPLSQAELKHALAIAATDAGVTVVDWPAAA